MSLAVDKSSTRGYDAAFVTNSTLVAIVLRPQIHSISYFAVLFFILVTTAFFYTRRHGCAKTGVAKLLPSPLSLSPLPSPLFALSAYLPW